MDIPSTANLTDLWATNVKQPIGAVRKHCDGKSPQQLAAVMRDAFRAYIEVRELLQAACHAFDDIQAEATDGVDKTTLDAKFETAIAVYAQADADHAAIWAQFVEVSMCVMDGCCRIGIGPERIGLLKRVLNSPPDETFSPPDGVEFIQPPVKVEMHWLACQSALVALDRAKAGQAVGQVDPPDNDPLKNDPLGKAMLLIKNNPSLTNAEVAKQVGVNAKTLNKKQWHPFRTLRNSMRDAGPIPTGSKSKDSNLEAWENDRE